MKGRERVNPGIPKGQLDKSVYKDPPKISSTAEKCPLLVKGTHPHKTYTVVTIGGTRTCTTHGVLEGPNVQMRRKRS
jgi:hypothetical protein